MLLKILCNCECYVNDVSIIERSKNQWRLFYLAGGIPLYKKCQRKAGHNGEKGITFNAFQESILCHPKFVRMMRVKEIANEFYASTKI